MAMTAGASTGLSNDINVTPMIDVLLVLLVIFIMAVPMMRKAIDVQLPDPDASRSTDGTDPQIVLEVLPGSAYRINSEVVTKEKLFARLKEIYAPRPMKVIFVKGDPTREVSGRDLRNGSGARRRREGDRHPAEGRTATQLTPMRATEQSRRE